MYADLKVGTRQYGDGASVGKKQSKNAKVAGTTSGSLGLRLGGMQVYQVKNKSVDK
jgi:inositol-hexakisphosphate 5-kinase